MVLNRNARSKFPLQSPVKQHEHFHLSMYLLPTHLDTFTLFQNIYS